MIKDYYVYGLFEKKEDIFDNLFYVGKGRGYRMYQHFWNYYLKENNSYNPHKINKIKKLERNNINYYAKKIESCLTEGKAYELENFIIEEVGLENLTNLHEGGLGAPSGEDNYMYNRRGKDAPFHGRSHSKETKEIMSKNHSGEDNPMYGNNHTKEALEEMSRNRSGKNNPFYGVTGKDHPCYSTGENHSQSKLSRKEAREIKYLATQSSLTQKEISNRYDSVCQSMVSNIKTEKNWPDVEPKEVDDLEDSQRGSQGFGSTGDK